MPANATRAADLYRVTGPGLRALDDLTLRHGQALWVLNELGLSAGVARVTFNEYIKSLRKLGVPFKRGEPGLGPQRLAGYSFIHLMELSLILGTRVYGVLPDVVAHALISFRGDLRGYYYKAFPERDCGLGAPIFVTTGGRKNSGFRMSGVYLDLQLTYSAGQLSSIGPPEIMVPFGALERFAQPVSPPRPLTPLNLSNIAVKVAELMTRAPPIRSGPSPIFRPNCHRRSPVLAISCFGTNRTVLLLLGSPRSEYSTPERSMKVAGMNR